MIQINNLKFNYDDKPILDIDSFSIHKGESIFLFGPSGSGKSTLLELISGVQAAASGEISILGEDLLKLNSAERDNFRAQNIGYIFQSFNLVPYLNVQENILLPFLINSNKATNFIEDFQNITNRLGLNHLLNNPVTKLSVGQQQRVAVARALIKKPKLILADEPTSSLDYDHRESFLKLLFELILPNQTTLLFVSHDRQIEKLFNRSIDLQKINKVKAH